MGELKGLFQATDLVISSPTNFKHLERPPCIKNNPIPPQTTETLKEYAFLGVDPKNP